MMCEATNRLDQYVICKLVAAIKHDNSKGLNMSEWILVSSFLHPPHEPVGLHPILFKFSSTSCSGSSDE